MDRTNRSNDFIDIDFQNVSYTVNVGTFSKQKKTILKKISGRFKCGELTAVMGPSGAGKSTLLNILSGFQTNGVKGDIRFTKQDNNYIKTKDDYKVIDTKLRNSSYIMQQDHLCSFFTVYEIMNIAANLKLPPSVSQSNTKRFIIDDILKRIGLTKVVNTRCRKLSGGQKKRLSIALELIANPSVMFLDEPTTGLDSKNSYKCMYILKSLAKEGRTIICTIHQPTATIFEMIDHVYIVADGRCAYQGSCYNIVPYLQTIGLHCPKYHNPADFILEVVCGEYGHFVSKLASIAKDTSWRSQQQPPFYHIDSSITSGDPIVKNGKEEKLKEYKKSDGDLTNSPSEWFRFILLVKICFIKLHRDWTSAYLKMCLHLLVGVFIGSLYTDCGRLGNKSIYNVGFLICSLVYMSYTSLMPAILKFPTELLILKKEIFNNWYKLSTYYLAFLVVNIPTQMLFCVLYSSVSYYLSSQILEWNRYFMFLITCQLVTVISEALGLTFGTLLSPVNGVFCGAVSICYFILFAGYVVMFEHMPHLLYFLSYTSFLRYSFEALVVAIYGYGRLKLECPLPEIYCYYSDPSTILRQLSMDELRFVSDIFVLVFYFITFSILSYVSLKIRIKKRT